MNKIAVVVNVYINTTPELNNTFDHPTDYNDFESVNSFKHFIKSLNSVVVPQKYEMELFVFAIATNQDLTKDREIKQKISCIVQGSDYSVYIITNSDVKELQSDGSEFPSSKGYCEIRNLGFIFPYYSEADYVVQFDDDEIIRPNYLVAMTDIYENNQNIFSLNGLYEKDGKVLVDDSVDYDSWGKNKAMNEDLIRLSKSGSPVESIFGLGGNMSFKREFFSQVCYPGGVSRGEDFALLLAARLVFANGNHLISLPPFKQEFRSYFTSSKDMTIIHQPPENGQVKKHKLKLDFTRFIMQRAFLKNYLDFNELYTLSRYIFQMLKIDDYLNFVKEVYDEAQSIDSSWYSDEFINSEIADIEKLLDDYQYRDLFAEYLVYQKKYIGYLEKNKIDINNYL